MIELYALDTYVSIQVDGVQSEEAADAGLKRLLDLEQILSCHIASSEIARLNTSDEEHPVVLSEKTYAFLEDVLELSEKTGGRFDPTVAPLMELWGFGEETAAIPDASELEEVLRHVDYHGVHLSSGNLAYVDAGCKVDLGGAAKGYIADQVMEEIRKYDVSKVILDLGGNIRCWKNSKKLTVGIVSPLDPHSLIATVELTDGSVVTSGAYERYKEIDGVRYGHIMDTKTGYPVETDLLSVTVIDKDGTRADVLATALFAMGKEEAEKFAGEYGVDCILCGEDGTLWISSGLKGKVECEQGWKPEYFG